MHIFSLIALVLSLACLNSCVWTESASAPEYLPLDDSEYPYADLPRLVIETENFAQIRDKETKIPAKMQIYGKNGPESEITDLTVKGRGNSSIGMSKYSMKMSFPQKTEMFGMPADKDWVLISNHADKTLLRNYTTFNIARQLKMNYVPRCTFVEVYLNRSYMGVYLLTENIKVNSHRLNIPKDNDNYLVEIDAYYGSDDTVVKTNKGLPLNIHHPKNCAHSCQESLKNFLDQWEQFIETPFHYDTLISNWIDIQDYSAYYWIEEFSKNIDSNLKTSVFFTWKKGEIIKMGPVWDFDLSYGDYKIIDPDKWYSRWGPWNTLLIKNVKFKQELAHYWKEHREVFAKSIDLIDSYKSQIEKAAKNNFRRWPILGTTFLWEFNHSYQNHDEAVDSLKSWMSQRLQWINANI